jgi:drug/metabolite transporter (DMT)-like permease
VIMLASVRRRFPAETHVITAAITACAIAAFAGNSLLTRAALGNDLIAPGAFSSIRLTAGALVLLPWFLRGGPRRVNLRQALALLLYVVAFSFAYRELNAGVGAMILFAAVQAVIIFSAWQSGQHLRGIEMAGLALALLGMIVLLGMPGGAVSLLPALTMAGAGCAWGLYTIMGRGTEQPARSTAGNFLFAAIFAAPIPLIEGPMAMTMSGLILAIVAGALTSGMGYVIWYTVVPRLRHATIGASQLATPIIAAVGGALYQLSLTFTHGPIGAVRWT